jgi:4-hydroxyphenylpyruvate dioxygenase
MDVRQYEAPSPVNTIGFQYKEIDHVEFYVSNARLASHFFRLVLGFQPVAYSGLETGVRDKESIVVKQGGIKLVLTAPLTPDSAVAEQVHRHGDGVKDIALAVADTELAFAEAVRGGAQPVMEPTVIEDDCGWLKKAVIGTFGDNVHSLIERDGFTENLLPHYVPIPNPPYTEPCGFQTIDHLALSVESGTLSAWIDFYNRVFGFQQTHQEDVITEYTAMNSKVVQNGNGLICFPIMEPSPSKRRSQIEEYLSFHRGPGVQHIAFSCDDIVGLTRHLKAKGMEFLHTPGTYYDALGERVGDFDQDLDALRELGILVDRDKHGYLLQIFSRPMHSRPTMFFELIQRKGATGFGGANIKALFEAIEREQARRNDW